MPGVKMYGGYMKKIFLTLPLFLIFTHLIYASDGPQVWTQDLTANGPVFQACIVLDPTTPQTMYAGTASAGVYKTTDGGSTWSQVNSGLSNLTVWALAISASSPSTLYAGTSSSGVFKTTNGGTSWTQVITGITDSPLGIQSISVSQTDPNDVLCCVWDGATANVTTGMFRTTNGGTSWTGSNAGMLACKNILTIVRNPLNHNTVYCGTSFLLPNPPGTGPCYVYKSYDGGSNWINSSAGLGQTTTNIDPIRCLSVGTDTVTVLAGLFWNSANGGPWYSTNGGGTWTQINNGFGITVFPGSLLRSCMIRPGSSAEFFVGCDATNQAPGGVWQTTNAGAVWSNFSGGTLSSTASVRAFAYRTSDNTVFAGVGGASGTTTGSVHEYTELPLGVHNPVSSTPKEFSLMQNYPNPFNPSTVIQFSIPKTSFVSLKIYDMLGREISTLVSETKQAGSYEYNFNASNLPSGVYLYKIAAGDFTAAKKMMLVK